MSETGAQRCCTLVLCRWIGLNLREDNDARYFHDPAAPPERSVRSLAGVYRSVFDVVRKSPVGDKFQAQVHLWKLGGLGMSRTSAPPVDVVRSKGHLRRDPVDHWIVSY